MRPVLYEEPKGDWELTLELPKELNGSIEIESAGRVRRVDDRHFILSPPRGGWDLPEWVDEYLEDAKSRPVKKL